MNVFLIIAGILSAVVAILHIGCIYLLRGVAGFFLVSSAVGSPHPKNLLALDKKAYVRQIAAVAARCCEP